MALCTAAWSVVTVLLVAAAVLLLAAAWFALREVLSPTLAALSTGLGALVAAVIIGLLAYGIRRRRSPAAATVASLLELAQSGRQEDVATELGALLGKEAASTIGRHPRSAVITAVVAGFIIGINPRLREAFRDILK